MKDYIRLTGTLVAICLIAAVLLVFTNNYTDPIIKENDRIKAEAAIKEVLPMGDTFEAVPEEIIAKMTENPEYANIVGATVGKKGTDVVGYAIKFATDGYGGKFEAMVGVDIEGKISGLSIGNNSETPGFGKKAELPAFYEQYVGKETGVTLANGNATDNQINQITGATVTSKAVNLGANQAIAVAKALANQ